MRAIIPEAEEYFEGLFQDYIRVLEDDHDVTSVREYLDLAGATSNLEDPDTIFEYIKSEDIGLSTFLECPPLLGQDIVYASLNPSMKDTIRKEHFESKQKQYGRIRSCQGDIEELAWKWARDFNGYLTSKPGPRKIVELLRESIDALPSKDENPFEDYVTVESRDDISNSYYGDVYHTQFFRLPSPKGKLLEKFDRHYWREKFAEEIQLSDPKLYVSGCKDAWLTVLNHIVDDQNNEIIAHGDAPVTSNYGNNSDDSAVYGVFEVPDEQLWVVTSYQESYYQWLKPEVLRENLEYVNERVSFN